MYVFNTEIAPVTKTAPFNMVPLKGAKIRYITFCIFVEWFFIGTFAGLHIKGGDVPSNYWKMFVIVVVHLIKFLN